MIYTLLRVLLVSSFLFVLLIPYLQDVRRLLKTYPVDPEVPKLTSDHGLPDGSLSSPMTFTRVPLASGPTIEPFGVVRALAYVSFGSRTMHSGPISLSFSPELVCWVMAD